MVFLVSALVVYFEFIQPAYEEAQKIKSEELSAKAFLDSEKAAVNQVQNLISNYKGQGQIQEVVSLALPLKEDLSGALAQIYGLAQNNDLGFQSVSISVGGPESTPRSLSLGTQETSFRSSLKKAFGKITLSVRLSGSYGDLKNFLSQLETNIRVFDVDSLIIQPTTIPGKPAQDLYTYDLTFATYYQVQ